MFVRVNVVAAIIRRDGQILITQRHGNVHLGGMWEFPGGKVEPGETLEAALQREIQEELGIKVRVDEEFFLIDHDYPTKSVRLHFFNCTIVAGEAQPLDVADLRWVEPGQLGDFQFPPADEQLIAKLRSIR
jgi:8-oxo-dGTP diphosphatase